MVLGSLDLHTIPPSVLAALFVVAAIVAIVQTFRVAWARIRVRRRLRFQTRRAQEGETRAATIVQNLGYTILGSQVVVSYPVWIDEEDGASAERRGQTREVTITLRADYLVSIRGRRYVAEVKTGKLATRIDTSATRRQLLEYRVAFGVDGVLLVDAETERVHIVRFPILDFA